MTQRSYSGLDRLLVQIDRGLKGIVGGARVNNKASPAADREQSELSNDDRAESARLMRINHCGEVCAQALYQGQALTASSPAVTTAMQQAAAEEMDHLAWCEQRLKELDGHLSYLNPLWYVSSLTIGMAAGALGDRFNLGFLAATEEQVCAHLDDHLQRLPVADESSRVILEQMRDDEAGHAHQARQAGAADFPDALRKLMWRVSRLMTRTVYRI